MTSQPLPVSGVVNLFKPVGLTSMAVVNRIKRLTRQKGVGHGGTLDPIADGVLPICFGQATRIMEYLIDSTKVYRMTVRLGVTTDTYDAEGQTVQVRDPSAVTRQQVEEALERFRGTILQTPPMYSALKKEGRRLYELARAGVEVEREPRRVQVFRLDIVDAQLPDVVVEVECGRGVYMRSLAHDLGEALGVGAHLAALTRVRHGPYDVDTAVTLERFEELCGQGQWQETLRPMEEVLLPLRPVELTSAQERVLRNGQPVDLGPSSHYAQHLESVRAYNSQGVFVGVLRFHKSEGVWKPYKVFRLAHPSPLAGVRQAAEHPQPGLHDLLSSGPS